MSIYLVVPMLVIVALLQATILPHLALWGIFPSLPILFVACWGLLRGVMEGSLWGFIAGIAVDILSGAPFGAATISLTAVGAVSGLTTSGVVRAHVALPMLTVFLVTLLYELFFLLILQISGQNVVWLESLVRIILPSAALNAILTPPLYATMRWIYNRFLREEMEW